MQLGELLFGSRVRPEQDPDILQIEAANLSRRDRGALEGSARRAEGENKRGTTHG